MQHNIQAGDIPFFQESQGFFPYITFYIGYPLQCFTMRDYNERKFYTSGAF